MASNGDLDFSTYGLIIDARTPAQYASGHIRGALNLWVFDNEQHEALSKKRSPEKELRGAAIGLSNIADWIDKHISRLGRQTRILVYSSRGAFRTKLWADPLSVIGFKVDVLPGGYVGLHTGAESARLNAASYCASEVCQVAKAMSDLARYSIVIDARSEREFAEDHVPTAINLPVVVTHEYAEVGVLHRLEKEAHQEPFQAYLIGVSYSLRNIAHWIETHIAKVPATDPILVYCFRGGKRSRLWYDPLRTIGFTVDRIDQGWKGYRRWVNNQLEEFPRSFRYRVLCGPTGCGKTRLLHALQSIGAQTLDLEALACHRGSVIGAIPSVQQPPQKLFDTLLLTQLRSFSPDRPVWVESESKKIGNRSLPDTLFEAMHDGTTYYVEAAMPARVALWREDYRHFEEDPKALVAQLAVLKPLVGGEEFSLWRELAESGQVVELFERLMVAHYDPQYARSISRHYGSIDNSPRIYLEDLGSDSLRAVAAKLVRD